MANSIKPEEQHIGKQCPYRDLNGRKESQSREGLRAALNPVEMEKPEGWPQGQTLVLDNANAECADAENQDPDCDDHRAEEQSPLSDGAHAGIVCPLEMMHR